MFIIWPHVRQFWIKPNVKDTQKSIFIFPLRPFPPSQCYRVAIVGSLVEKAASRCFSRSFINIE